MHNNFSLKVIIAAMQIGSTFSYAHALSIYLFKRGDVQELSASHSGGGHVTVDHSKTSCATNKQCHLNDHPKIRFKHVWSLSPDNYALSKAKKQRSDMFRPRKDLSKLNLAHPIKLKTNNKDVADKEILLVRKKGTILPQDQPGFKGSFDSRRNYLRNQHKHGMLSTSEALEYQRTIRAKQEEYNQKRREKRKLERTAKKQTKDKE